MTYSLSIPAHFDGRERPFVIAHRGDRIHYPENSMAAFRAALQAGADALETDLHITKDRVIVVHHDETVDRMTDGSGQVNAMTLAEIKALRLRAPDGTLTDEQIPTLDEFLAEFGETTYFLLELKKPAWATTEDMHLLLDVLDQHNVRDKLTLASFEKPILDVLKRQAPEVWRAPIMMFNLWPPADHPMIGVIWPMLYLNPLYVWLVHRRGQIFCPLDPTPEPRLGYYLRLGVDFVLSDDPGKTIAALKRLRQG